MDYGALPPEFNSGLMYAGPGPESFLTAAAAWNSLAAEWTSVANSYQSVIAGLISDWLGPSSAAMAAAVAPYIAWITATAGEAELTATGAQAAASAFETAFAMMVPPPVIAANRTQLMNLVATNLLGQNTPAIAVNETQYGEMWAQDAAAMYGYAAASAVIGARITPFTPAPETTNAAGLAAQGGATGGSAGNSASTSLSKLVSSVPTTLQNLASPGSSTPTSGISPLADGASGGASGGGTTTAAGPLGGLIDSNGVATSLVSQYLGMPGWAGISLMSTFISPLQTLMTTPINNALSAAPAVAADGAAAGAADAAAGAAAAEGAVGSGLGGIADVGAAAGVGEAASVGALSVPPNWGWAASGLSGVGSVPLTLPGISVDAPGSLPMAAGLPMMAGGLPGLAGAGAIGAAAGLARGKYLPRLNVVARSPEAGYSAASAAPPAAKYPVPATFPTNGHAPPGYQPAIVYLPTNGDEAAKT